MTSAARASLDPEQLFAVLSAIADGVTVHDVAYRLIYVNEAAARASGYPSREAMLAAPVGDFLRLFELLTPEGAPFPLDQLPGRRVAHGAPHAEAVVRLRARDTGEERWSEVKARPVHDPDGRVALVINIFHDITALVRARADADAARQRAQFLARASAILGSSLDYTTTLQSIAKLVVPDLADWCVVEILEDDGTLRTLAVAHAEPEKVRWALELRERYPPQLDADGGVAHVLRTGRAELYPEITVEMLRAAAQDAEHHRLLGDLGMTSVMIVPLRSRDRTLGALSFVTAESRVRYDEDDLAFAEELGRRAGVAVDNARLFRHAEEAREAAVEASRAKSGFLATISHEIRTPINAIVGYAQLLEIGVGGVLAPEHAQQVARIRASGQHLSTIVNDFLDWAKIEAGALTVERKRVLVAPVVESALELVRAAAETRALQLTVEGPADAAFVGDEQRARQVLLNLLANAVKFTSEAGVVRVSWASDRQPPAVLGLPALSWIAMTIGDTGNGIPAEKLESIFEPFRQGSTGYSRAQGGTGLGLSISRRLARLMGGEVSVSSRAGEGAEFTLWLPRG